MVDQRATDERLEGYLTPREIKLEIVAESPVLSRAGAVCFGTDGSLMLLEWSPEALAQAKEVMEPVAYRDGSRRSFVRTATPVKDAVKVVRDINGKGAFDQAKVVLEEAQLTCILTHDNWLYTAGTGSVAPVAAAAGRMGPLTSRRSSHAASAARVCGQPLASLSILTVRY